MLFIDHAVECTQPAQRNRPGSRSAVAKPPRRHFRNLLEQQNASGRCPMYRTTLSNFYKMNRRILNAIFAVALLLLFLPATSQAHENRPLYIDITEQGLDLYQVQIKVPPTVAINNQPSVLMPEFCSLKGRNLYQCSEALAEQFITIRFAKYNPSVSTFVRLTRSNREIYSDLLTAEEDRWQVPNEETASGVAKHYTWLGVEHILIGLDHLLFLACLLFIARGFKRVVITITGFTLAHSVTLIASAMQWVKVPIAPVETLIAFSILFLAVEIARKELFNGEESTLTYRHPILVSLSFGLLHGFGFAAVLSDIGLPQTEVVTGLLFFNIGVELGQLAFTVVCLALGTISARLLASQPLQHAAVSVAIYGIGILSAYWLFDRGASVFMG